MEFRNSKEAIEYLKSLDDIIVPSQFTYFNHCTRYQTPSIQKDTKSRGWTSLPLNEFIVKNEMSFKDRNMRIIQALEKGGVENAEVNYGVFPYAKNFMIRVIMPKENLSMEDNNELGIDAEYKKELYQIYHPFTDGRHPKLNSGEKILIFACSTVDEVSGKTVDIFYGVREKDVIMYAKKVASELEKQKSYPQSIMPIAEKSQNGAYYNFDHNLGGFDKETYSIKKSKDFSRYKDVKIIGNNEKGPVNGTEFTKEYIYEVQQEVISKKAKDKQKLERAIGFSIDDYYTAVVGNKLVNLPKTREKLNDEYLILYSEIRNRRYSNLSGFSDAYIHELQKILKQVYDDMKKNIGNNAKTAPLKIDTPVDTTLEKQITIDRRAKQKQELIELKNDLIENQYDEYGVEIKKINEEIMKRQQVEKAHNVNKVR